ncbi:MAG: AAA family ATPase [Candidatus Thiodiazotropha sp. (ex Troendleina suluensis)]|nr:AAA family ATPase [Candidatus Thiodiazotropha sp. (ex Troendleina suluensis)]
MTPNAEDLDLQHHLIQQLLKSPACFGHTLDQVEHIETHISHLLLVGETVYKIKKPLNLGFLDFSTLEKRRLCCEEELRLNRRLAPTLYLDVVGIGGSIEQPIMNADSGILEYAVRMRRFRQQDLLNITLPDRDMIERLAVLIADFHQMIPAVSEEMPYGKPNNVFKPMEENFQLIRGLKQPLLEIERLNILQTWTEQQASVLESLMEERYQSGHIRECHGDLHLGNIALFEGRITPFDGIEFNPNLRWIDTLSDIAFLIMDLQHRGLNPDADRLLNVYLEQSGDYAGLLLLRFYLLYRAMVRAKVTAIRASQEGLPYEEREQLLVEYRSFLSLAESITRHPPASLIITHGYSGSGKSIISGWLAEQMMAIRLRSDIERKRLFPEQGVADETTASGRYSDKATQVTYTHLMGMAKRLLRNGFSVIIDATFLAYWQREMFLQMAESQQAPILIIDCQARQTLLYDRIKHRSEQGNDPSEADLTVLMHQQQSCEPLTSYEHERTVTVDSEQFPPPGLLATVLQRLMR